MTTRQRTRKKRTIVEEDIPDNGTGSTVLDDTSEFDIALEGAEDQETLKEVLEQFGQRDNVLYRIYKQTPTGPSFAYESPQFDEAFLQRERGAGAYQVRIFINSRFKRNMTVQVEPPLNNPAHPNGNGISRDTHSDFLEKMLMVLVTNLATGSAQHQGPSLTDMTAALANLDGLRGKQENVMETFIKGLTLGKEFAGDAGSGDWKTELLKMGRDAIPAISSIVQSKVVTQPEQPPVNGKEPQPPMIDITKATPEQKRMMLEQAITFLKQQCFGGLDAESALNFIVTNSGNPQYQIIIKEVLAIPFEELVKIDVEIASEPFNLFFRALYDGLRSEFGGDDPMDDNTRGDPGNDHHPGGNGSAG